jgi:hypothetical protein
MYNKNDIVLARDNKTYQVIKEFTDDRLGKQVLCRLYRSQKTMAWYPRNIRIHPLFA